jgi:hypothetical protein
MADTTLTPADLAAAVSFVRFLLNESTQDFWSDTDLQTCVKLATIEISTTASVVEATATESLVSGTSEYTQPADCMAIVAVTYDGASLLPATPAERGRQVEENNGDPTHYYHFAKKVGIIPTPGADQAGNPITIYYHKFNEDITALVEHAKLAAVYYAAALAKAKEKNFDQASFFFGLYSRAIGLDAGVATGRGSGIEGISRDPKETGRYPIAYNYGVRNG